MTQRIHGIEPAAASGKVKELFETIQGKMKMIPNLFRVFANSPKVLEGFLSLSGNLSQDSLSPKLREQIALTCAENNGCGYCLSAHTALGKMAGLNESETQSAQSGKASDPKTEAALKFARAIIDTRGHVSDTDLQSIKSAGYTEAQIIEIVSHVVLNIFTNYANNVAKTTIDFPVVSFATKKAA